MSEYKNVLIQIKRELHKKIKTNAAMREITIKKYVEEILLKGMEKLKKEKENNEHNEEI